MVTDNTTTALVIFAVAGVLGLLAIIGVDIITTIHEAEGRSNVAECTQIPTIKSSHNGTQRVCHSLR